MRIDETDGGYLTTEYVMSILPTRYQRAFAKALKWSNPTASYIGLSDYDQAHAVLQRKKPLAYGFKEDTQKTLASQFRLENLHDCLFLPENGDLADLVGYAISRFEIHSPIRHFIIGIACGYPLDEVQRFASQYVRPTEQLQKGLQKHDKGDTVR